MRDDVIRLFRERRNEFGHGELLSGRVERLEAGGEFGQEMLHANAVVSGELDAGVVRVKLMRYASLGCIVAYRD